MEPELPSATSIWPRFVIIQISQLTIVRVNNLIFTYLYLEHGHYNVPAQCRYDCVLEGLGDDGGDIHYFGRLGRWLDRQKCAKRGMKKTTKLTPEHEAQLQELVDKGLLRWDASAIRNMAKERRHSEGKGPKLPHVSLWSKHFAALKKYGEEHGHCNIPLGENYRCVLHGLGPDGEDYQYEGRLGKWLYAQRCAKKGVKDTKVSEM